MKTEVQKFMIWCLAAVSAALISHSLAAEVRPPAPAEVSVKGMSSNQEIFGWIKEICAFGIRRTGTAADHDTANYILDKFKEFGLHDAHLEPIPMPRWDAKTWSLTVNGQDVPCFFMAHSSWVTEYNGFVGGADGIEAEMVYVGDGWKSDFRKVDVKGKIVVADISFTQLCQDDSRGVSYFAYDPNNTVPPDWCQPNPYSPNNFPGNFQRAIKGGAVGFVGILNDYFDRNTYYNELYAEEPCLWPIPGLWVSRSDGARLKSLLKHDGGDRARLVLDGSIEHATAYNVIGWLPGKSDDIIMVHSHHDAPWASAVEDASGVSEVLALAKYFGAQPADPREKTIMFATLDTHFSMYQGHLDLIRKLREQNKNVIVDIALEHIGKDVEEQNGKLVETGYVCPRGIFVTENPYLIDITSRAVQRNNLERTLLLPTYTILGVPTDAGDFNRAGFTIISLISPPIYIYDEIDTPEMVAVEELNPVATAFAEIIESIDQTPAPVVAKKHWIPKYRFQYYSAAVKYIIKMIKD